MLGQRSEGLRHVFALGGWLVIHLATVISAAATAGEPSVTIRAIVDQPVQQRPKVTNTVPRSTLTGNPAHLEDNADWRRRVGQ